MSSRRNGEGFEEDCSVIYLVSKAQLWNGFDRSNRLSKVREISFM